MEIAGPINLIYNLFMGTPSFTQLPLSHQLVAGLYCVHYLNRAVISPFFSAPSMSPIHLVVMSSAMVFNWFNSACLAAWLRGYSMPIPGFRTDSAGATGVPANGSANASSGSLVAILPFIGAMMFFIGMVGNIHSERTLFRLRREEAESRAAKKSDSEEKPGNKYHKVYVIPPTRGVFRSVLYPHYVFEWLEWTGFVLAGTAVFPLPAAAGGGAAPSLRPAPWLIPAAWAADRLNVPLPLPAVIFLINAVTNMLPHARWGRRWYVEKFGEKGVAGRGAVVPWCSWM